MLHVHRLHHQLLRLITVIQYDFTSVFLNIQAYTYGCLYLVDRERSPTPPPIIKYNYGMRRKIYFLIIVYEWALNFIQNVNS